MTMSGKRNSLPLVKGQGERKRSSRVHLPPCGGGRPPEQGEGGREGGLQRDGKSNCTPLPSPPPQGGREQAGASGEKDFGKEQTREAAALYRLMAWLSPSFPVGAFSYSSGIEWAVEAGDIHDAASLTDWLSLMMTDGGGFCDGVLFAQTHRAVCAGDSAALRAVAELAAAFSPSRERHLETTAQGRAFRDAVRSAWPCEAITMLDAAWDGPLAYPTAVGATCAGHGIALEVALPAFLHAVAANWISAGVRLIPLGQTDGQRVLAALEKPIALTVARARAASLDDIGGAVLRADLASMRHETQYTRLFRS